MTHPRFKVLVPLSRFIGGALLGLPIAFFGSLVLGDVKKAAYVAQLWPSALRPPHVRSVDHKLGLSERLLVVCNGACDEVRR